jgi:hypothetical protein
MRSFACVSLLCCVLSAPRPAAAQRGQEANLVLTIVGGTVIGHQLWTIDRQALSVLGSSSPTKYDTLRLSRALTSGIVLGVAATYFPSPHLGFHAEISYLGLGLDSTCDPVHLNTDSAGGSIDLRRNGQVCDDISAQIPVGSMISIFGGATLRAASRGSFSPYVRGGIGFVNQSGSTIDVAGAFFDGVSLNQRQVIIDLKPRHTDPMAALAAGFTSPLGPGYQFRLEVRDHIINLIKLTGPGSAAGASPTASGYYHHIALTLGLDIVMEKKRGRRY